MTMRTYVLGEFQDGPALVQAARALREAGYHNLEAYGPYGIEGADEVLGIGRSGVATVVLVGGVVGASFGFLLQWFCNTVDYPINVGGRPMLSAPVFVPITFELGILFAATWGFIALLAFCGLPRLYHPVFEVEGFRRASIDRFWLSVIVDGDETVRRDVAGKLSALSAKDVSSVEVTA
jgi:hypothetical protein